MTLRPLQRVLSSSKQGSRAFARVEAMMAVMRVVNSILKKVLLVVVERC